MNGVKLENVASFKYLGCVLKWDLDDSDDILKCLSAFNRSFGFLYRKFYSVNIEILFSLFLSFCSSFYGAELWFYRSKCKEAFNKMAVSYHCALKKILGVPKFYSNHLTCSVLGAFTFNHFVNIKITKFIWWIIDCQSLCFYFFKNYFLRSSTFIERFEKMWQDAYEVPDVLVNDRMALLSRISFVQNREPSSLFGGLTL